MSLDGTVVRGDDIQLTISVVDENGDAVDLTGITAANFKMKLSLNGNIVLQKTLGSGVTVSNAVGGVLIVAIPNADSALLKTKTHLIEVELVDFAGKISTVRNEDVSPGQLTIVADL